MSIKGPLRADMDCILPYTERVSTQLVCHATRVSSLTIFASQGDWQADPQHEENETFLSVAPLKPSRTRETGRPVRPFQAKRRRVASLTAAQFCNCNLWDCTCKHRTLIKVTILYHTILYSTLLYSTLLYYRMLYYTIV